MNTTFFSKRMAAAWAAGLLAGVLAVAAPWLERFRPISMGEQAKYEFHVTSSADSGTGSLREAIFLADRADGRVRLVVDAPGITLTTTLPPIINPAGIVIDTPRQSVPIDASALAAGPVLDVASPNAAISGLAITGASDQAVMLRTSGARLTRMRVQRAGVGIFAVDGVSDVTVTDSDFDANGIGIQLGSGSRGIVLRGNHFRRHVRAAVWSVAPFPPPLSAPPAIEVAENDFTADETSIVMMNTGGRIHDNDFAGARTAAVFVHGSAATVRRNRMQSSLGFGISADGLVQGEISENEINHNCGGGILVRQAEGTRISLNRLYSNGYGIVMVLGPTGSPNAIVDNTVMRSAIDGLYIIGASPLIRQNRLLQNAGFGLRLSSLSSEDGPPVESRPLVEANTLTGNRADVPVVDEFRVASQEEAPGALHDCAWRDRTAEARVMGPAR